MKIGRSIVSLARELDRQLATKQDLLVPSPQMFYTTNENGASTVRINVNGDDKDYGITELARRQLADKLKIPFPYFERMRVDQPELLDRNVNTWLTSGNDRRMIRTLDGRVRAVLSDRYRRLDNFDLAEHVLPILEDLPGAKFESVELTETRMYLKVVTDRVQLEVAPGDIVQAGVVISNSEVGHGTLYVQPLVYRLICKNGAIASDQGLRKTHLGRITESEAAAAVLFEEDTLRADDKAFFLKVRDVVQASVSEVSFRVIAEKMKQTMGIKLVGDPVKTVEVLANRYSLNDAERAGVLRHLIQEADLSGYGLINAVTGYSQEIEDYDRATEFEVLGGRLIELKRSDWEPLALAA